MNRFLLLYGNEQSVAVYGCIGYITSIIYLLPSFFKLVSVWLAVPLAQAATFVISVIAALLLFIMPMVGVVLLNVMIAAFLIVSGVTLLIEAICMRKINL